MTARTGWRAPSLAAPRVRADRVDGVADHVVTTTEELRRAFRTLEDGDTVRIAGGVYPAGGGTGARHPRDGR